MQEKFVLPEEYRVADCLREAEDVLFKAVAGKRLKKASAKEIKK